jgi:hypothetical protein
MDRLGLDKAVKLPWPGLVPSVSIPSMALFMWKT